MTIATGDRLPDATFFTMTDDGPAQKTTAELFAGKTVVLFAVPGAFTPTCTAQHLPSFVANAESLTAKGVAAIYCTAVNDIFALDAWGKSQAANGKVTMLADPDATFAKALDLSFDGSAFGLGIRSARYAMVVKDGVVTSVNVEESPGAFDVSSAEKILESV